jgi:hypothetical protein
MARKIAKLEEKRHLLQGKSFMTCSSKPKRENIKAENVFLFIESEGKKKRGKAILFSKKSGEKWLKEIYFSLSFVITTVEHSKAREKKKTKQTFHLLTGFFVAPAISDFLKSFFLMATYRTLEMVLPLPHYGPAS